MPRHSKDRAPWRHLKRQRMRVGRPVQWSLCIKRHFRTNEQRFWVNFYLRNSASRSFRYLSLSLQNGVLRNQGDTGVRALPTIKPDPTTVQMVLLGPRPFSLLANRSFNAPLCTFCTKCRGSEPHISFWSFSSGDRTGWTYRVPSMQWRDVTTE